MAGYIERRLLFPRPESSYSTSTYPTQLFWIPAKTKSSAATASAASNTTKKHPQEIADEECDIPCLLFQSAAQSDLLMIFAHGNGCDLGGMHATLQYYSYHLQCHVLCFEYPSYGISLGHPSEVSFYSRVFRVYDFVTTTLQWKSERLLLFGNSIGTACITKLASELNQQHIDVGAIVLQCPFTDIGSVVRDFAGRIGKLASNYVDNRFDNLANIKHVTSPIYIIHGLSDSLIPASHSQQLYDACGTKEQNKHILFINQATHNEFELRTDIVKPVSHLINMYLRPPTIEPKTIDYNLPSQLIVPSKCYDTPPVVEAHFKRLAEIEAAEELKRTQRQASYAKASASFGAVATAFTGFFRSANTSAGCRPNAVISGPTVDDRTQKRIAQQLAATNGRSLLTPASEQQQQAKSIALNHQQQNTTPAVGTDEFSLQSPSSERLQVAAAVAPTTKQSTPTTAGGTTTLVPAYAAVASPVSNKQQKTPPATPSRPKSSHSPHSSTNKPAYAIATGSSVQQPIASPMKAQQVSFRPKPKG